MLIASVCFFTFFFVGFLILHLQTVQEINPYIIWGFMVFSEVYTGAYIWISYQWLTACKKWDMRMEVHLFWGIYAVVMLAASFLPDNAFCALAAYWIMTAVLAIVPLWNNKEFLVSQGFQIAVIVLLVWYRESGIETIIYLSANQLMCGIISRQGYYNFLQRAADANAIDTAKSLSETDPMTNLLNRRGLEHNLKYIWQRCVSSNSRMTVIMIDIDNFKKYNDYFGHLEGDNCIRRVTAEIHKMICRKTDFAARVGGEEFVVCLNDMDKREALKWAIQLKQSVEGLRIPQAEDNFLPFVTVSVGIAWGYARSSNHFTRMQKQADEALYEAKENGRACVCIEGKCYAKTSMAGNKQRYYLEKGFRSLG